MNGEIVIPELKVNDVYDFRYKPEIAEKTFSPYHCFDGTLKVRRRDNGTFYFLDTYWSSGDSRVFEVEEAYTKGELKFLCNLDEMEEIKEHDCKYYSDEDIVYLKIHAGYHSKYLIKKGTERSKNKMIEAVKQQIYDTQNTIKYAQESLVRLNEKLSEIESGKIDIYI